jgi:hypothetical protein
MLPPDSSTSLLCLITFTCISNERLWSMSFTMTSMAFTFEPSKASGVRLTNLPVTGMSSLGLPTISIQAVFAAFQRYLAGIAQ